MIWGILSLLITVSVNKPPHLQSQPQLSDEVQELLTKTFGKTLTWMTKTSVTVLFQAR